MAAPRLCRALLVLAAWRCAAGGASWSYTGDHGQEHWAETFPDCAGTSQSPINIKTWEAVHDGSLPAVQPVGYRTPDVPTFSLTNNGHTVKLSLPSSMRLVGLPYNYTAAQLHFHWGSEDRPGGSEHHIDDQAYPGELHIVHYNADVDTKDKPNGLAVLGILITVGPKANPGFANIIDYLDRVSYANQSVAVPSFNMEDLLPDNLDRYFRYSGSLTTPPCSESVLWTVFSDPVQISQSQMEKLRTGLHSTPRNRPPEVLENNVRHIQPVNDRTVYASFIMDKGLSVGVIVAVVFGVLGGLLLISIALYVAIVVIKRPTAQVEKA